MGFDLFMLISERGSWSMVPVHTAVAYQHPIHSMEFVASVGGTPLPTRGGRDSDPAAAPCHMQDPGGLVFTCGGVTTTGRVTFVTEKLGRDAQGVIGGAL